MNLQLKDFDNEGIQIAVIYIIFSMVNKLNIQNKKYYALWVFGKVLLAYMSYYFIYSSWYFWEIYRFFSLRLAWSKVCFCLKENISINRFKVWELIIFYMDWVAHILENVNNLNSISNISLA